MDYKEETLGIYDKWHEDNRLAILNGQWNLIDEDILTNPGKDKFRGLNLISFLPASINDEIDNRLLPKIKQVVSQSGWFFPKEARHITVLDIIPHNSGLGMEEIRKLQDKYVNAIDQALSNWNLPVIVGLEGVFASPDGITIQGFPINEGLSRLRNALRQTLNTVELLNLEHKKYLIETAHIGFVKFIQGIDGDKLITLVDNLRKVPLGTFQVDEIVLNISPRYDKTKTAEVIKRYKLGKS